MIFFDDLKDGKYKPVDPERVKQLLKDCNVRIEIRTINCNLSEVQFIETEHIPPELLEEYRQDIEKANKIGGVQMLQAHMDVDLKWKEKLGL